MGKAGGGAQGGGQEGTLGSQCGGKGCSQGEGKFCDIDDSDNQTNVQQKET